MVVPGGIEPPTQGFSVLCSTDWAMKPNMAVPTGLEPAIFCVTGRRVNQLHHGTMVAGGGLEPPTSGLWAQRATNCSIPRYGGGKGIWTTCIIKWPTSIKIIEAPLTRLGYSSKKIIMAEEKGFEPLRRLHDLPVFKTGPFNQTWVFLQNNGA